MFLLLCHKRFLLVHLIVFKPEPVTVSDSRELVDDDRPKERTRTVRSRLEHSSWPDVDVIDVAVVEIAEVREDLKIMQRLLGCSMTSTTARRRTCEATEICLDDRRF